MSPSQRPPHRRHRCLTGHRCPIGDFSKSSQRDWDVQGVHSRRRLTPIRRTSKQDGNLPTRWLDCVLDTEAKVLLCAGLQCRTNVPDVHRPVGDGGRVVTGKACSDAVHRHRQRVALPQHVPDLDNAVGQRRPHLHRIDVQAATDVIHRHVILQHPRDSAPDDGPTSTDLRRDAHMHRTPLEGQHAPVRDGGCGVMEATPAH